HSLLPSQWAPGAGKDGFLTYFLCLFVFFVAISGDTGMHRRTFLADVGLGLTGLALGSLLFRDGVARADGVSHFAPKVKSVIRLFMCGGVSHVESFDPKPALNQYAGKTIDESPFKKDVLDSPYYRKKVMDFTGTPRALMNKLYPLQVGFRKHGQS